MQDEHHYLSDVIFGAGLGVAISKGFAKVYRKTHRGNSAVSSSVNINLTFPL
jgi:membrane-associated phospholipid phosphatase